MLRPPRVCSTLGVCDRIRVPGPAASTRTAVSPRDAIDSPSCRSLARRACAVVRRHAVKSGIYCTLAAKTAPSPGLEPELSEPKSEVLPITPRRTAYQGWASGARELCGNIATKTLACDTPAPSLA